PDAPHAGAPREAHEVGDLGMQQGLAQEVQPEHGVAAGAVARDALEQRARQEAERTRQLLARAEGAALVAVVGELDADPAREGQGGRHRDRILALRPAAPRGYPLRPRRRRMPERIAGIQPGYLPWLGYFDQM